jgi:hypothetical protein
VTFVTGGRVAGLFAATRALAFFGPAFLKAVFFTAAFFTDVFARAAAFFATVFRGGAAAAFFLPAVFALGAALLAEDFFPAPFRPLAVLAISIPLRSNQTSTRLFTPCHLTFKRRS